MHKLTVVKLVTQPRESRGRWVRAAEIMDKRRFAKLMEFPGEGRQQPMASRPCMACERFGIRPAAPAVDPTGQSGMYTMGASLTGTAQGAANQRKGALKISKSDLTFMFPSLALNALKSSGDAKLVASPNIRVVSGKDGTVNIGEKVSTTQNSFGAMGGANTGTTGNTASSAMSGLGIGGLSTSYAYENVGVKIKVTPRVHFNNDITLELDADVSTLVASSDSGRPNIGTRNIKTTARLKDGETAVFGGLLKDEEQKSLQGIWGLTDIPVLGKLLGNTHRNRAKTDVILTIRAVLVRTPDLTEDDFEPYDPDAVAQKEKRPPAPKAEEEEAAAPVAAPAPKPPAAPAAAPATKPRPEEPAAAPAPKPAEAVAAPQAPQAPIAKSPEPAPPKAEADAGGSELVFFISPMNEHLAKGERIRLNILASGGKGITEGSLDLMIDPKLSVVMVGAGEFITTEGGAVDQAPGKNGALTVKFRRGGGATDSGSLLWVELEAKQTGNAPVVIQSGAFRAGTIPVSGRWVNALVTVD